MGKGLEWVAVWFVQDGIRGIIRGEIKQAGSQRPLGEVEFSSVFLSIGLNPLVPIVLSCSGVFCSNLESTTGPRRGNLLVGFFTFGSISIFPTPTTPTAPDITIIFITEIVLQQNHHLVPLHHTDNHHNR